MKGGQPKLGLVLSGGGAAGIGHIPVLQALDDLGIRPTAIAGVSIGAIVGASYAAGVSGDDLHRHFSKLGHRPWRQLARLVFTGGLARNRASFPLNPHWFVKTLLPPNVGERFEDLDIPFTLTALDYRAGRNVRFASGPLRPALAASIAVPGAFKPVRLGDGKVYVDGGIVENLPLGTQPDVDKTLAVNVFNPTGKQSDRMPPQGAAAIRSVALMISELTEAHIARNPPDILLRPQLPIYGARAMWRVDEILARAEPFRDAARKALQDLLKDTP